MTISTTDALQAQGLSASQAKQLASAMQSAYSYAGLKEFVAWTGTHQ